MQKLKLSKTDTKWLFLSWVVFSILLTQIFYLLPIGDSYVIAINNKNPDWCNRYEYYLENTHIVTNRCLSNCWKLYGCDANATGSYTETCYCNNIPLLTPTYNKQWWLDYNVTR